jgi:hypothetical protein
MSDEMGLGDSANEHLAKTDGTEPKIPAGAGDSPVAGDAPVTGDAPVVTPETPPGPDDVPPDSPAHSPEQNPGMTTTQNMRHT